VPAEVPYDTTIGDLLTSADALHNTTRYAWSNGLLMSETTPHLAGTPAGGGVYYATSTNVYDADRRLSVQFDDLGNPSYDFYDTNGNLNATLDALGRFSQIFDDNNNQLVQTIDAAGGVTTDSYDGRDRLIQVVSNLVNNAVKYSPEGGTATLASRLEGHFALISVSDTGIGIPPDEIGHVFERFRRVRSGAAQSIPGTGLGLTIVKQIVEMHGGKIWVESAVGHGSSFHFTIPLAPEAANAMHLRHG